VDGCGVDGAESVEGVAAPSSDAETCSFGRFCLEEAEEKGVVAEVGVCIDSSAVAKEVTELARDSARGGSGSGFDFGVSEADGSASLPRPGGLDICFGMSETSLVCWLSVAAGAVSPLAGSLASRLLP
jgi:hypothetical protein